MDGRVQLLVVAAVGLLAYANTFEAPFTFDDARCIVANPVLRDAGYFLEPDRAASLPLSLQCGFPTRYAGHLTFALNYRLGGIEPAGYHAVNLAVHVGSALLVYLLVALALRSPFFEGRPSQPRARAFLPVLAALLFVAHPLQTGAVTYVTQRFASLATLLYLAAVVLYLAARLSGAPGRSVLAYGGALGAASVAMVTKEIAVTLPFALVLCELSFLRGPWPRRLLRLAPFLATPLILAWVLGAFAPGTTLAGFDEGLQQAGQSTLSRGEYVVTQLRVIATYLRLFVLPVGQNLDWDYPQYRSPLALPVLLSLALHSALLALAIALHVRSRRPEAPGELRLGSFGLLWFFLAHAPESSVVPLSDILFEHRMYLPSVGLCVAAASLALALRERLLRTRPAAAAAVVPAISAAVLVLAAATFARNHVWGDEVRLWEDAAGKSPSKLRPRMQLAALYSARGRFDDALREAQAAISLRPGSAEARNTLGVILRRQGRLPEAMESYLAALQLDPGFAEARHNVALLLAAEGHLDEAIRELEQAVRSKPDYAEARNALGVLYAQRGRLPEAIREWEAVLRIHPTHAKARANLDRAVRGY